MTATTYLVPIVAIVLGAVFNSETVEPIAVVGVAPLLAGAYRATRAVATSQGHGQPRPQVPVVPTA